MKKQSLFLLLLSILFVTGCILSVHPIYTDNDLIFEPKLIGVFIEDNEETTWSFESTSAKEYLLTYSEKTIKGQFYVHCMKLGNYEILDLYPYELPENFNNFYKYHFAPMHTFLLITFKDDNLLISVMNIKKIQELIEKDNSVIRHEKIDDTILLTASTDQLQKFIQKYGDKVYEEPTVFKRLK